MASTKTFHAASPAPAAVPASPLPSSKNTTTSLGNLQWLLRKRPNKVQHGWPVENHQETADDGDGYDDECASMFAGARPYIARGSGPDNATPPCKCKATRRGGGEALWRLRSAILAVLARAPSPAPSSGAAVGASTWRCRPTRAPHPPSW
jgi:hypothetical protein